MKVCTEITLLEDLLDGWRDILGCDYPAYRNHCFRVFNFCVALSGATAGRRDVIAIATGFHDIGIWTSRSFDYLGPSRILARDYLANTGRGSLADEVAAMIENHHKITPCRRDADGLVETFRRADWIDVSLGRLRFGLPRSFVHETLAAFPNAGFHGFLLAQTWRRMKTQPLSPLPMMRL